MYDMNSYKDNYQFFGILVSIYFDCNFHDGYISYWRKRMGLRSYVEITQNMLYIYPAGVTLIKSTGELLNMAILTKDYYV